MLSPMIRSLVGYNGGKTKHSFALEQGMTNAKSTKYAKDDYHL